MFIPAGFQLLHAVYAVEKFLSNLYKRGCNFDVLFFSDLQSACVPAGSPNNHECKFQLFRKILIEHLVRSPPAVNRDGLIPRIFEFDSINSKKAAEYFDNNTTHFVLCHEGDYDGSPATTCLQLLIHRFLSDGNYVAFMGGVEWRNSKVNKSSKAIPSFISNC